MKTRKKIPFLIAVISCLVFLLSNCVDPIELKAIDTQNLLVVEANLTNENKRQEVRLSRTNTLEDSTIIRESNAIVLITDNTGNSYDFTEESAGLYTSNETFAAQNSLSYQLEIQTANGILYTSTEQRISEAVAISNVYAQPTRNAENEEGVTIFVDTETSENTAYFRYEFEETSKIVAPKWNAFEADIISRDRENPIVDLKLREQPNRICYKDSLSTNIILSSTDNVGSNQLISLPIRFIKRDNYLIEHRYSILVKQYTQNVESHEFYIILRDLSSSSNFFTELQPGFVAGNLSSENDDKENVVGFFNVSSVSERRIFFNYSDIFTDEKVVKFDFPSTCREFSPALKGITTTFDSPLITSLDLGSIVYQEVKDFEVIPEGFEGPYVLVPRVCGDCTVLGSTEVPEFWVD